MQFGIRFPTLIGTYAGFSETTSISQTMTGYMFMRSLSLCAAIIFAGGPDTPEVEPSSSLIVRNQTKLKLKGAELVLKAAQKKAVGMKLAMNIAVVDDGGHLLVFARMDGARPASAQTALTKAMSAATFRQATGPIPSTGEPNMLLSLGIPAAAAANGGKITTLRGGLPIIIDGQVIGAIGVGGGSGEQDFEVAEAGVAELVKSLGMDPP
jgi:glc operon protein GlcG